MQHPLSDTWLPTWIYLETLYNHNLGEQKNTWNAAAIGLFQPLGEVDLGAPKPPPLLDPIHSDAGGYKNW